MKYHQPYGTGENSPYINGDPSIGRQGSIIPAEAVEYPQREMCNFFNISNILPADSDMYQLARSVQVGMVNFATDIGAQNALVCNLAPPIMGMEYPTGLMIRLKLLHDILNDASHTSVTLNAGIGVRNVVMPDGGLPADRALKAGGVYLFIFDGTRWQIAGAPASGGGGTGTTYAVNIPYIVDTGPSSNNITAIYVPPVPAITEGLFIAVKLAHPLITAVCNITVNTFPVKKICRADGTSPVAGDADTNQILLLCFDGVNFQIIGVLGIPVSRPILRACVPYPYGMSLAGNTAVQISGLSVILSNTLNTSTFDGTVMRVGEGEGGLWHVTSVCTVGNFIQRTVYTGNVRIRQGHTDHFVGSRGSGLAPAFPSDCHGVGSSIMPLEPGDVVTTWGAQYLYPGYPSALPYYQPGHPWGGGSQPNPNIEFTFLGRPSSGV